MSIVEIVGGVVIMVCAIIIVIAVMAQEGKQGAMNALSGGNDSSYLGHNKNRSNQAMLVRFTKYTGIVFVAATLIVYLAVSAMK